MRRILVRVIASVAALCLVALTAVLINVLDKALSTRMSELKEQTVTALEKLVGRRITYGSISPSILQFVEIHDLSIYDSMDSEKLLLTIRKMRVSYSILQLLAHRDPLSALREIRIENSDFDVDLTRDEDVVRLLEELQKSGTGGEPIGFRISGANVTVNIVMEGAAFSLSDTFFTLDSRAGSFDVSLRGGARGSLGAEFSFRSALKVEGKLGKVFDWSDLTFRFSSFSSSLIDTEAQTLQLIWRGESLEVRKIWDSSPVDLQFLADLGNKVFTLNFQADGFQPNRQFRLAGRFQKYNNWLDAPLTASGYVTYDLLHKDFDYKVDLTTFFADQLPFPEVHVSTHLFGSENTVFFEPLSLTSPSGSMEFIGDILFKNLYPQGLLTVANLEAFHGEKMNAKLVIDRLPEGLQVHGKQFELGQIAFNPLEVSVVPGKEGERIHLSASFAGEPHTHSILADGTFAMNGKPSLSLSTSLANAPPDKIFSLITGLVGSSRALKNVESILSQFALTAGVSLDTDFKDFTLTARPILISQWEDAKTRVQCSLTMDRKSLSISDFSGSWRGYTVNGGYFTGRVTPEGPLAISTALTVGGIPYSLSGSYDFGTISLAGSYGLDVGLSWTENVYMLRAKADHLPLPFAGPIQGVSFGLEGRFASSEDWRITFPTFTVYDIPLLESRENVTEMSVSLTPGLLIASRIRFIDGISLLEGSGKAEYRFSVNPFDAGFLDDLDTRFTLDLKAPGSTENIGVTGSVKTGSLNVKADFSTIPLARFGKFALAGTLAGSASVEGPIRQPAADFSVSLQNGRLGTDPIAMSARVGLNGSRLELKSLTVSYLAHKILDSTGVLQLDQGTYAFSTRYQGVFFQDKVETLARLEGSIKASSWESFLSHFLDSSVRGKLALSSIKVNGSDFPSWGLDVRTENGNVYFDGGPQGSLHGSIDSTSAFTLTLESPLPVVGKAVGKITGDHIESTLDVDTVDMRILNPILKSPIISVTSGVASGTLTLSGPVNDPDYTGQLQLIGGGITCIYVKDEAGPVSTTLTFNGKTFSFPVVSAATGRSRLSAEGSFTVDHWVPVSFSIDMRTENQTATHMTGKFGAVRIDGYATGYVKISGDESRTDVKGSLVASDCRISLGPAKWGKFVPEELPTFLTLDVQTGKRVEFEWPSTEVPVVRTMAKSGNTLAVTYRGDTGAYTVKGSADIQGGEVFYFDRSFVLKSGKIVFDETQDAIDPRITVRAEMREYDPKTNEMVKIYLDADDKLSMFSPRFTSDPPRSDLDVLAMIGAPLVAKAETQGIGTSALLLGSDFFSQFWILRPFEQKVREILGLDTFSLRTQLVQNLVAQKVFGTEINPLDNTSLSLGKYIGNDLYLEMLVRLQSQQAILGLPSAAATLRPDFEINIEWQTPFFLLDWSFIPRNPQTLFLTDNSISLNWRISY